MLIIFSLGVISCAASQKKIASDKEKSAQYQYEKAVIAMKYGLADQALDYANQALTLDPRHYLSLNLLGVIHLQKRNFVEAASALEKCLEIKTDYPDALNYLGAVYIESGRKEEAEALFQKSFALDGNAYAAYNLAKLGYEKKEMPSALSYVDQAIQKYGSKPFAPAYNLKGVVLNQMERYTEAVSAFLSALALTPADPNIQINLGISYMNNKQYDKALETFEKALPLVQDSGLKEKIGEYIRALKERT
jgi:tetratricopeptide (TPR) repeat protein